MTAKLEINSLPMATKNLPVIMREIVDNAPERRKVESFIATLAPLCALATRVRFRYTYDNKDSALLLQVIIEGEQSSGKSFASNIEQIITKKLKEHDLEQRRIEQDYRERKKTRKANEKLDKEPVSDIRVIPPSISKTVLVKRADMFQRKYNDMLTFWMFSEELAMVTDAGKSAYSNLRTIMRTAYDLGSEFGLDFASDNSYSAIVDINICSMFCATPSALDSYMDRANIEGGNVTRTILCPLDDEMGSEGIIYHNLSQKDEVVIQNALKEIMDDVYDGDNHLQPTSFLDMSFLHDSVKRWVNEKADEAVVTNSNAIDVFRKRSSVSAFRVATLCYYLYKFEYSDEEIIRRRVTTIYKWMANYIFNNMYKRWGDMYDELVTKRKCKYKGKRQFILANLPETFERADIENIREQCGFQTKVKDLLASWKHRGYIAVIDDNKFVKTKKCHAVLNVYQPTERD